MYRAEKRALRKLDKKQFLILERKNFWWTKDTDGDAEWIRRKKNELEA